MHLGPVKTQTLIRRDCGSDLGPWQGRWQEPLWQLRVEEMLRLRCLICGLIARGRDRRRAEAPCGGVSGRKSMNFRARPNILALVCAASAFTGVGFKCAAAQSALIEELVEEHGPSSQLVLTLAQRNAIYQEVHKDRSKVAPDRFATDVGAVVPPMIDLYTLPDDLLANNPATQLFKFTEVDDQVVLVDPTKMRVIAVIDSKAKE